MMENLLEIFKTFNDVHLKIFNGNKKTKTNVSRFEN